MAKDPKEAFKTLYETYGRDELAQAGRTHLEGDLKLKARRHTRWFWIAFAIGLVLVIWLTILGIIYVLERARDSADRFELHRRERLDQIDKD